MITDNNYPHHNNSFADNFNYDIDPNEPGSNIPNLNITQHPTRHTFTKLNIDQHLKRFSDNFNGTPNIIIESKDTSSGSGF